MAPRSKVDVPSVPLDWATLEWAIDQAVNAVLSVDALLDNLRALRDPTHHPSSLVWGRPTSPREEAGLAPSIDPQPGAEARLRPLAIAARDKYLRGQRERLERRRQLEREERAIVAGVRADMAKAAKRRAATKAVRT